MANNENLKKAKGFNINPQNINRKGAPKTKLLKDVLNQDLETEIDGVDRLTVIISKLTDLALKGNLNAIKEVLDRHSGKSVQHNVSETDISINAFDVRKLYDREAEEDLE